MRVFDCRDGCYISLSEIYEIIKMPLTLHLFLRGRDGEESTDFDTVTVTYETNEQRDAAFRDAFDVVGKCA